MINTLELFNLVSRSFVTASNLRSARLFSQKSQQSDIIEIGQFTDGMDRSLPYNKGQLFVHRVFAYRGIIISSTNCKVYTHSNEKMQQNDSFYYQVLIDSDDWEEMNFDHGLSTCLHSNGTNEKKNILAYHGIDVVAHDEVLPYKRSIPRNDDVPGTAETAAIKNALYNQFFKLAHEEKAEPSSSQQDFLFNPFLPQAVHTQTTNSIEVQVLPFYLGTTNVKQGLTHHFWRCLFRLRNLEKTPIILTERKLGISSMSIQKYDEEAPLRKELTASKCATQLIAHFEMPSLKGNIIYGHFIAEDDEKRQLKLQIPRVPLEGSHTALEEQIGNV